ncbi:SRPBCC family protein [Nonomuraea solani]
MSALVARGIVLTVERFTVGYVLEEQAGPPGEDALDGFGMAGFAEAYPTVIAGVAECFQPGRTGGDLFRECAALIVEGPGRGRRMVPTLPEIDGRWVMGERQVSVTRIINADSDTIFDLLADPRKHHLIDGSGTVGEPKTDAPERLSMGARFGMDMKMSVSYKVRNEVVEFEEGRLIAWRHGGGHRWRWRLEPLDPGTTRVTETFDWSTAKIGLLFPLLGFPSRNRAGMEKSLERLANLLER